MNLKKEKLNLQDKEVVLGIEEEDVWKILGKGIVMKTGKELNIKLIGIMYTGSHYG